MQGILIPPVLFPIPLPLSFLFITSTGDVTTFITSVGMNHEENFFFVANCESHTISKIASSGTLSLSLLLSFITDDQLIRHQGTVTVFAGSGRQGHDDGVGIQTSLNSPRWLAIDKETVATIRFGGSHLKVYLFHII